jgi:hypothetical protein
MIKKQTLFALVLLLLIPAVTLGAGILFSLINPEIAAGHPNYTHNWHLLYSLKMGVMYGSFLVILALYLFGCFLVIRSKQQSRLWLILAPFGPLGFAVLSVLNDRAPSAADQYSRFVSRLNVWLRVGYEVLSFVVISELGWQIMILKRNLMIWYQSLTTGVSTAQIIAIQDASSGMWAFGEGLEVMFFVIFLYLLRPILFNLIARHYRVQHPERRSL